jgi:phage tail tape-measure protein
MQGGGRAGSSAGVGIPFASRKQLASQGLAIGRGIVDLFQTSAPRSAAFLGQGKCVTRPSLTQWQQEETRPTTRTLCIYDTVTLTLTRPSHHARA